MGDVRRAGRSLLLVTVLALASCASQDGSGNAFPGGAVPDYQLGGAYEPPADVGVVVRDASDEPAEGIYSICYLNAFQTQPGEERSWLAADLVLEVDGEPVTDPDWPDEYLLDTGTDAKRAAVADRIGTAIDGCADSGFDAVELDNLDSYLRSEGRLTLDDNVMLARTLAERAHDLGLQVGQKNAAEESAALQDAGFDFAVAEQCVEFEECDAYTDVYGEAVLAVEYPEESGLPDPCAVDGRPASTVLRDLELVTPADPGYLYRAC
ncbi:endo alpha-1,4 polygalactosaminidase [Arthrobacter sp. RIT-PI-e]|uniref:endo alpha-1,4 polygalactosaminidase n=1 Tax=Arthrobacter sp. RIT-PI-e TaxID=1681197 RepID=UPI001F46E9B1|nr:endo alpha-1,4 polygalactosaminidase [Arthrobacter sp. RIT-PI-e]